MSSRLKLGIVAFLVILTMSYGLYVSNNRHPNTSLHVATGTSIYDSGLLDYLIPFFEEQNEEIAVSIIPRGTGLALEMAKRGDADMVLVHNRDLEEQFVSEGFGLYRTSVMYNDFVIVGPIDDPAATHGKDIGGILRAIASAGKADHTTFISRADKSGTHLHERSLWDQAGIPVDGRPWYIETAQGARTSLLIAEERNSYTLVDRGTWNAFKSELRLSVFGENENLLLNPYSLILTNPLQNPTTNSEGAKAFSVFLLSEKGQELIGSFKKDGEVLFKPLFGKAESIGLPPEVDSVSFWNSHLIKSSNPTVRGRITDESSVFQIGPSELLGIIGISFMVTGIATVIGAAIGIPLGAMMGLRGFRGQNSLAALVNTLASIPPVLVGLLLYLLLSQQGTLGPLSLLFTPHAMILAQLIIITPIIASMVYTSVVGVNKLVKDQIVSLGASTRQLATKIVTEAKFSIVTAILLAFGRGISEVGAVMLVGGALRGETWTLTVAIFQSTNQGEIGLAIILGAILLVLAYSINVTVTFLRTRNR